MTLDLGAAHSTHTQRFTIYLSERNCFGEVIADIELWIREAAYILTTITGGATRLAPASGMWFNRTEGLLIEETTHIVYTIYDPMRFSQDAHLIRDFLHRFGHETMQESVAVEFGGRMHFITDFKERPKRPRLEVVA